MEDDFLPLDVEALSLVSGNIYKSVYIVGKRANQLTLELKDELARKLAEFAPAHDNLDEIMENREQIEISRFYERKPKPSQDSVHFFLDGKTYWRDRDNPLDTNAPDLNV
ncbi:MAG TPA: RNA polymerase Rpb6 [Bacteroidetes bacterium]|nr:RNA polymerase Rpb6 [Bacteroidota bacterium]